jgi:acyl carrier protein
MEKIVLEIINQIRLSKEMTPLTELHADANLRDDLGFTSFDLAELTVNIEDKFEIDIFEDGLINTIGEIYAKLS